MTDPTEKAVRPNGPTRLLSRRLAPISMGMVGVGRAALPLDVPVGMPGDVTVDMASPVVRSVVSGLLRARDRRRCLH